MRLLLQSLCLCDYGEKICLVFSPLTYTMSPLTCLDQSQRGSLFTLFLYSPLLAFSSVCGLNSLRRGVWERAQEFLHKVYRDIGQMLTRSRTIGSICPIDSFMSANMLWRLEWTMKNVTCFHFTFFIFQVKNSINHGKSNAFCWSLI